MNNKKLQNLINQVNKALDIFERTKDRRPFVALEDQLYVDECIKLSFDEMKRYEEFAKEKNITIIDSYTNFVTLCFSEIQNSTQIADALLRQGMIVRDLSGYGMNAIRVTVGSKEQNNRFFQLALKLL